MSRRAMIYFVGLSVAWGIPYLLIKVAVEEITPLQLVFGRTVIGALLLLPLAAARGWLRPVLRYWPRLLAFSLVEVTVPWLLLSRAEQHLSSSLAGLLIAAVPIVAVGVAMATRQHTPLGRPGVLGMFIGIVGVALLVGVDVGGSAWSAVGEMAGVVVCYAVGAAMLGRWFVGLPGPGVIAAALGLAALTYLPFTLTDLPHQFPSARVSSSVVVLGVLCTAAALLMMAALVAEVGPVRATTFTYVNPAVAVVAGVVLLDEPLTAATIGGFVLVIAGSVLVNSRRRTVARYDGAPPCPEVDMTPVTARS